jgi:recombinational DNA repair protein RecT
MSNTLTIKELNAMTPIQVLEHEAVKERFISLYNRMHKREDGEVFFEKEKYALIRLINQSKELLECQGFSVYGAFIDLASMGLTIVSQGNNPYLYVLSRKFNEGGDTKETSRWVRRMKIEVSPYGELSLRIAAGQIKYADTVKIAYEGDLLKIGSDRNGKQFIEFEASIPRKSTTIIGAFVKVVRPDNSFDISYMVKEDWERLAGFSLKQNSYGNSNGKANALYTSCNGGIDPGFLAAKVLKHAFGTFPKIALGQFATLSQTEEVQAIDYGLDEEIPVDQMSVDTEPFDADQNGDYSNLTNEEEAGIPVEVNDDMPW